MAIVVSYQIEEEIMIRIKLNQDGRSEEGRVAFRNIVLTPAQK
jgi:hypothetical protein